jgi:hypothetical protein
LETQEKYGWMMFENDLKNCIRARGKIAGDRDAWKLILESKNTHGPESVEKQI